MAKATWQPDPVIGEIWDENNPCFPKPMATALHQLLLEKLKDPQFKLNYGMSNNANIIALNASNQALLVLETNPANGNYLFGFPGGRRQKNEDPLKTAMREWMEETGIVLSDFKTLDIICRAKSGTADVIIVITTDNIDVSTKIDHSALFMTLMSMKEIKPSQDIWFSLEESNAERLTVCETNETRSKDKFRLRQCVFHGLEDVRIDRHNAVEP